MERTDLVQFFGDLVVGLYQWCFSFMPRSDGSTLASAACIPTIQNNTIKNDKINRRTRIDP